MTVAWQWGIIRGSEARLISPILKVGGSLLASSDWPAALAELTSQIDRPLLVVGGGGIVDGLRAIDAANPRPPQLMHELAIKAMSLTARLVANALGLPVVSCPRVLTPAVLDIADWLANAERPPTIPVGWEVTSDSLAAVAAVASGRSLILAKSVPPPPHAISMPSLARENWVDAWFPGAIGPTTAVGWAAPAQ
jgi:aspartokinase-like uncharacterized kinase